MTGEELFWDLIEPMYADPAVQRSTMMGLPCVRLDGRFFASLDRRTAALLVKLPRNRITELLADGTGEEFAPAGRVFREWIAVPEPDRALWQRLLTEARDHAAGTVSTTANVTPGPAAFTGFGADGLAFLAGLDRDNTKRYFDAHRHTYQQDLLEPSKALVVALGGELQRRVSDTIHAEPRIGASLFRIANDRRFTPNKPPYKPHLDMVFWEGSTGPRTDPAFILRITATGIHLGAGVPTLTGTRRDRYRAALRDPALAADLDSAVTALTNAGTELSEPTRTRPPAGLTTTGPAGQFAIRDGFYLVQQHPHPDPITTELFVTWCTDQLIRFAPVHRWLARCLADPAGSEPASRPTPSAPANATAGPRA